MLSEEYVDQGAMCDVEAYVYMPLCEEIGYGNSTSRPRLLVINVAVSDT